MNIKRLIHGGVAVASVLALHATAGEQPTSPNGVADLHVRLINPASDGLFQAESTPPSTPQEWERVRAHAAELEKAASRLASRDLAKDQGQWMQFAQALKGHAQQALAAAQKRDQDALITANGDIVSVCEDCHAKYRDAGRSMKQ